MGSNPPSTRTLHVGSSTTAVTLRVEAPCAGDTAKHFLDLEPSGQFVILGYQSGRSEVPVQLQGIREHRPADIQAAKFGELVRGTFLGNSYGVGIAAITAPFWVPIYLAANSVNTPYFVADCFIWAEDAETGAVVAGTPPWPMKAEEPSATGKASFMRGPRQEGESFVNCASEGRRVWTYLSNCD